MSAGPGGGTGDDTRGDTVDDTRDDTGDDTVRARLLELRAHTTAQLADAAHELGDIVDASALVATDDEHDPEGATIAFERAQVSAVSEQLTRHLAEIDHALQRLDDGVYGTCERCGGPIADARLEARPSAVTCIGCASSQR